MVDINLDDDVTDPSKGEDSPSSDSSSEENGDDDGEGDEGPPKGDDQSQTEPMAE